MDTTTGLPGFRVPVKGITFRIVGKGVPRRRRRGRWLLDRCAQLSGGSAESVLRGLGAGHAGQVTLCSSQGHSRVRHGRLERIEMVLSAIIGTDETGEYAVGSNHLGLNTRELHSGVVEREEDERSAEGRHQRVTAGGSRKAVQLGVVSTRGRHGVFSSSWEASNRRAWFHMVSKRLAE